MPLEGPKTLKYESDVLLEAAKFEPLMDRRFFDRIFQVSVSLNALHELKKVAVRGEEKRERNLMCIFLC